MTQVTLPASIDPGAAVAVPLMWVTAWQMLTRVAPLPTVAKILVVSENGSVGRWCR